MIAVSTAQSPVTSPRRILVVEDEALIAMVLEDILDMLGHAVVGTAGTYPEAEQAIDAGGFDLAILDVNLGNDAIFPLADQLASAGVTIIFATGSHPDSLPERFRTVPVLEKPYTIRAVEVALAQIA
ncbi:MAG: response regulator [Janthinobacterium lividum]